MVMEMAHSFLLYYQRLNRERQKILEIVDGRTYFPEKERKSRKIRYREIKNWLKTNGEVNEFYNLYGFDIVDSDISDYVPYEFFRVSRNRINNLNSVESQTAILRDKLKFYKHCRSYGIPTPEVFGYNEGGVWYDLSGDFQKKKDYLIKERTGECASWIRYCKTYEDLLNIDSLPRSGIICQERIQQCKEMSLINSLSINTLRIVTVYNNGHPYILSSILRIGCKKTGFVDNWAKGGIAIGINRHGGLKQYGFFKPGFGTKCERHPDSGIVFKQFNVPQYNLALDLAKKAHSTFGDIETIGWDIAITDKGPCFIEGNDNWEISLMQCCDKPLMKQWKHILSEFERIKPL